MGQSFGTPFAVITQLGDCNLLLLYSTHCVHPFFQEYCDNICLKFCLKRVENNCLECLEVVAHSTDLCNMADSTNVDIILSVETKIDSSIHLGEILPNSYLENVARVNRKRVVMVNCSSKR